MNIYLILIFVALILRGYLLFKTKVNFDEYGHYLFTKFTLSSTKFHPNKIDLNIVNSEPFEYPLLWQATIGRIFYSSNIFNDRLKLLFLETIIVITSALLLSSEVNPFQLILFYLLSPFSFTSFSTGPRLGFSPRLSIELISSIGFIFLFLGLSKSEYFFLFMSLIMFTYSCLAAKFANQAIFIIMLLISIFLLSFEMLLFSLILFFFCNICSKGEHIKQLKQQFLHLKWWQQKSSLGLVTYDSRIFPKFNLGVNVKEFLKQIFDQFLFKNSITSVFFKNPIIYLSISFIFIDFFNQATSFNNIQLAELNNFILFAFMSSFIVWILTSTKKFLFLGESERYFNYVWPFPILIFFEHELSNQIFHWFIIYGFIYLIFELSFKILNKDSKKNNTGVFKFLSNLPSSNILFTKYHVSGGVWRALCETNHKVLYPISAGEIERNIFEKKYPSKNVITDIENKFILHIAKDYSIKYIISQVDNIQLENVLEKIIYRDKNFVVYELP